MAQILVALVDRTGLFVEDVLVDENKLTPFHVRTRAPGGFVRPKWDGYKWVEGGTISLADRIAARQTEVNAIRDRKYLEGFVYSGYLFELDMEAQLNMAAVRLALLAGNQNAHGGAWRTKDNRMIPMSDQEVSDFINAAMEYVKIIKGVSWYHKDALAALKTVSAVDKYDITVGWPTVESLAE